jgi:hypothetical protein
MEDGKYVDGSVWFYAPNKGAPVFFAAAFLASGVYHLWQTMYEKSVPRSYTNSSRRLTIHRHYKCWRLTGLYIICPALFVAGFITREVGAFDYSDLVKYIVSICLVYASP